MDWSSLLPLLVVGLMFFFMMRRGGGCCGGGSSRPRDISKTPLSEDKTQPEREQPRRS